MAVKVSTVGSRKSGVGGLGVRIVCDLDVVLVFGARSVSSHNRSGVGHAVNYARHLVLSSVGVISCHLDAVSGLLSDQAGESFDVVVGFLLVEVGLGHSHELCSVLGAGNSLAIVGLCLLSTITLRGQ